jgi:hypothetical protein
LLISNCKIAKVETANQELKDGSEEDDYIILRCGECDAVIVEGESHDPECSRA